MTRVLLLNTDFSGEIKKCKVKDGNIIIDDKEFVVYGVRPFNVRSFMKNDELYICKWDTLIASDYDTKEIEIKRKELEEKLKSEGLDEKEIENIKNRIKEYEDKENLKINKFVYKRLQPIEPIWVKTKLPHLLRDTAKLRFLRTMRGYSEGSSFGMSMGKTAIFVFIVIFILIFALSFSMKAMK